MFQRSVKLMLLDSPFIRYCGNLEAGAVEDKNASRRISSLPRFSLTNFRIARGWLVLLGKSSRMVGFCLSSELILELLSFSNQSISSTKTCKYLNFPRVTAENDRGLGVIGAGRGSALTWETTVRSRGSGGEKVLLSVNSN